MMTLYQCYTFQFWNIILRDVAFWMHNFYDFTAKYSWD